MCENGTSCNILMIANYQSIVIMKHLRLLSCLLISFLFVSCEYNTEVRRVAEDFFDALKVGDVTKMIELYPEVGELGSAYPSVAISIKKINQLPDSTYEVVLLNTYANRMGATRDIETRLFIQPHNPDAPEEGYYIYDSQGLFFPEADPAYEFAKRRGYFSGIDHTDLNIARRLSQARIDFKEHINKLANYLRENVVADWNWDNSFGLGSGSGVITNNTKFTIPDISYVITYYKRDGTEVTKDSGRLSFELRPSGTESFSFVTNHVGNASKAEVTLNFDQDFLITTAARYDF